jgi:hypothetical protein
MKPATIYNLAVAAVLAAPCLAYLIAHTLHHLKP